MSILYCSIPHFAVALMQRDDTSLQHQPLVLLGPDGRVFAASAEAAACAIIPGLAAHAAEIRCPQARFLEADVAQCRAEFEALLQLLEQTSPAVEAHGWGAAYMDLGDLARGSSEAVAICSQVGQEIRRQFGEPLQPALGWDSTKFTSQAAARRARLGHLLAVTSVRERAFLRPLSVMLLPLGEDILRRLGFLGLRTLGQYATLPSAAVLQQFGQAGRLAQQCARGEDSRPVIPRAQEQRLVAHFDGEHPLAEREQLLTILRRLVAPLLRGLRRKLQAYGQVRVTVQFADGSAQERERTLLLPTADEERTLLVLGQLLDALQWRMGAKSLQVALERIQDSVVEQLTLFPAQTEKERQLRQVESYLTARFGAHRLQRAILAHPAAPLPEWRANWLSVLDPAFCAGEMEDS
jgi:nucleotidyltransferase/DNA polymerase involved in DNA repair